MPNTLGTEAGLKVGPVILEILIKHYFRRLHGSASAVAARKAGTGAGKRTGNLREDEVLYDSAFTLAKTFMEAATKHTVEDLQQFSNTRTPSPPWTHVVRVRIPLACADAAAQHLVAALGGAAHCKRVVGGTKWWQVRGVKGIEAQWITAKKDWQEAEQRRRRKASMAGESTSRSRSRSTRDDDDAQDNAHLAPDPDSEPEDAPHATSAPSDPASATYAPEMDALRCILYLHGGGYYFGSADQERYAAQRLARKLRARVLAPNYRLAPQYPFPCAVQDVLAAYLYLIRPPEGASHAPVPPAHIVLAGDSAGGGLVWALLQVLRDAGLPMPAGAVLISPWCDLTHSFPSIHENTDTDVVPATGLSLHKPSLLWPPPPEEVTTRVHEGLRARVKRIVGLQHSGHMNDGVGGGGGVNGVGREREWEGNGKGFGNGAGAGAGAGHGRGHEAPPSSFRFSGRSGAGTGTEPLANGRGGTLGGGSGSGAGSGVRGTTPASGVVDREGPSISTSLGTGSGTVSRSASSKSTTGRARSHSHSQSVNLSLGSFGALHLAPQQLHRNRSYQNMKPPGNGHGNGNGDAGGRTSPDTASVHTRSAVADHHPSPNPNSRQNGGASIPAITTSAPPPLDPAGSQEIVLVASSGETLRIAEQVQLYTTNALLAHPLVSPCMGFLGGLCPVMVIAGDKEVLRDEIIYTAHRAARPEKYPIKEEIRQLYPALERIEDCYGPTRVHLQVYDEAAHVLPVLFPFTTPAKYCFRAMALFMKYVTGIIQPPDHDHHPIHAFAHTAHGRPYVDPALNLSPVADDSDFESDGELGLGHAHGRPRERERDLDSPRDDLFFTPPIAFSPAANGSDASLPLPVSPPTSGPLTPALQAPKLHVPASLPRSGSARSALYALDVNGSAEHGRAQMHTPLERQHPASPRLFSSLSRGSGGWGRTMIPFDVGAEKARVNSADLDVAGPRFDEGVEGPNLRGPGTAGDPSVYASPFGISPFKDHMVRERISTQGIIRPLEPEHELAACRMRPEQVGTISELSARRYINGRADFDRRFTTNIRTVSKHRDRAIEASKKESLRAIANLQADLFQDPPPSPQTTGRKGVKEGLYAATAGSWSWAWALDGDERPPPSSIVARRDTEEARRLGKIADQALLPQETLISGNTLWSAIVNLLTASPERGGGDSSGSAGGRDDGEKEADGRVLKEGPKKLRRKSLIAGSVAREKEKSPGGEMPSVKRSSTLFEKLLPRPRNVTSVFSTGPHNSPLAEHAPSSYAPPS